MSEERDEARLERMSKAIGLSVEEIEKRINLAKDHLAGRTEESRSLQLLDDPKCTLVDIAEAYERESDRNPHSIVAAQLMVYWHKRSFTALKNAILTANVQVIISVYNHCPDDELMEGGILLTLSDFFEKYGEHEE